MRAHKLAESPTYKTSMETRSRRLDARIMQTRNDFCLLIKLNAGTVPSNGSSAGSFENVSHAIGGWIRFSQRYRGPL